MRITVGLLALILLAMVPVEGSPALHLNDRAVYRLAASIAFPIPICETSPMTDAQTMMTVCPMMLEAPPTININGTLAWAVMSLNKTTVGLNVTKDLSISSEDGTTLPGFHVVRSFNESIDLATRIATVVPLIMPEVEDAIAQVQNNLGVALPPGVSLASSFSAAEPIIRPPLYTMWWVNGPLNLNESVPVLFMHTNVTGATTVDLGGSMGKIDAWTLFYSFPRVSPLAQPVTVGTNVSPISESFGGNFTFNYGRNDASLNDTLLSATANVRFGFIMHTPYLPQCNAQCPATSGPTIVTTSFGFSVHASLILASIGPSPNTGTGPSPINVQGTSGGPSTGGNGGSGSSSSGSGPSQGINPGSGSSSDKTPQSIPTAPQPAVFPWIYLLLAIVALAIIASSAWISRRRNRKTEPQTASAIP